MNQHMLAFAIFEKIIGCDGQKFHEECRKMKFSY